MSFTVLKFFPIFGLWFPRNSSFLSWKSGWAQIENVDLVKVFYWFLKIFTVSGASIAVRALIMGFKNRTFCTLLIFWAFTVPYLVTRLKRARLARRGFNPFRLIGSGSKAPLYYFHFNWADISNESPTSVVFPRTHRVRSNFIFLLRFTFQRNEKFIYSVLTSLDISDVDTVWTWSRQTSTPPISKYLSGIFSPSHIKLTYINKDFKSVKRP